MYFSPKITPYNKVLRVLEIKPWYYVISKNRIMCLYNNNNNNNVSMATSVCINGYTPTWNSVAQEFNIFHCVGPITVDISEVEIELKLMLCCYIVGFHFISSLSRYIIIYRCSGWVKFEFKHKSIAQEKWFQVDGVVLYF